MSGIALAGVLVGITIVGIRWGMTAMRAKARARGGAADTAPRPFRSASLAGARKQHYNRRELT